MSATKLAILRALLAKPEVSYNGGGSVAAATDGILLAGPSVVLQEPLHDGSRTPPPGMAGNMRRVSPSGMGLNFPILHELKGAGAAYSASVKGSGHNLLLAAGFDAAGSFGAGTERWDFTPTPFTSVPTSLVAEIYDREQKYPCQGIYLSLESIDAPDLGVPLWTFNARGIKGTVADTAVPAVTYPALTIEPPKVAGASLTLGSFTSNAILRSWSLKMNRALGARANMNVAGGHAGFSPGRRNPVFEVLIEATDLVGSPFHTSAGLDPYQLFENGTETAGQINIGSVQYNRWKLIFGKLQMMAPVAEEEDEGGALWRLTFQCNPTAVNLNDDVTVRLD